MLILQYIILFCSITLEAATALLCLLLLRKSTFVPVHETEYRQ